MTGLPDEDAAMPYDPMDYEAQSVAEKVREKHEMRLMSIEGVEGVGVGEDKAGNEVLMIYLREEAAKDRIPEEIDGLPVRTTVTGRIDAY